MKKCNSNYCNCLNCETKDRDNKALYEVTLLIEGIKVKSPLCKKCLESLKTDCCEILEITKLNTKYGNK